MPLSPRLLRPRAAGGDSDVRNYIAAVEIADGQQLEQAVKDAIRDFILGCKSDGIWSDIKASCILMGARTLAGALTPLAGTAPTNNFFNSTDYNRKTGLVGNGSSKYLDSNRASNADPQNSYHLSAYIAATTGAGLYIGEYEPSANLNLLERFQNFHTSYVRTNSFLGAGAAAAGFFGAARAASNTWSARNLGANYSSTSSSVAPTSRNVTVFAGNSPSGVVGFVSARISFYSIGQSLTLSLLDSRVTALYNAIGAAVSPNYADADVNAYINAVETADGQLLETSVRDAINTFVTGCKADNIWSSIKASCILMGARTLAGALTPLVGAAPTNVNFVSGDYSRTLGIRGDGTSKYINAGYLSNADPQNDAHACVWVTAPPATNQISPIFGSGWLDGNGRSGVWNSGSGGNANGGFGEAIATCHGGLYQQSINRFTGAWAVSRSSSSQFVFRPGGSTDITFTAASGTPSANNIRILGVAIGGGLFSNARASFYSIGRAINISTMSSRLSALATAIGAAIP